MRLGFGPESADGWLAVMVTCCDHPRARATPQHRAITSHRFSRFASRCDCCKVMSQNAPLQMRFSATLLRCPFTVKLGQAVVLGAENTLATSPSREMVGAVDGRRCENGVTASLGWCNYLLHRQRCDVETAQIRQADLSRSEDAGAPNRTLERRRSGELSHRIALARFASRCDWCKVMSQNAPLRMRFSATLLRCLFTVKLGQVVVLGVVNTLATSPSREMVGAVDGRRCENGVTASWGWCNYLLHRQRCNADSAQTR